MDYLYYMYSCICLYNSCVCIIIHLLIYAHLWILSHYFWYISTTYSVVFLKMREFNVIEFCNSQTIYKWELVTHNTHIYTMRMNMKGDCTRVQKESLLFRSIRVRSVKKKSWAHATVPRLLSLVREYRLFFFIFLSFISSLSFFLFLVFHKIVTRVLRL